ncbi:apicoplast ribosomal protein L29 precursor, putative [Hepatocystis sp. ex Piliocolobus tephrosceles]|nr:apicoplast ribosomal protein L29 precursor, putative [Hepatocystis sp. ex Piliocolobus tephrosceles]
MICLFFYLFKVYLIEGISLKRECVSLFLQNNLNIAKKKTNKNSLFNYKKKVKAKELRKLTNEQLEKEIVQCRLDIQMFQHQGFHDMHNFNIYYEKNAKRKLAQLLTIYYERYLDKNIKLKS